MGIQDMVSLIATNGMAVVIVAYFLYKDYKFNGQLISIMSETRETLASIKEIMKKEV